MNKALLYIRVSSKAQENEGYSLDAQEKLGQEYARRNNLRIVKSWKVSESAWRSERDAFNQMIDYAKRHLEIQHIIFDVTDRMTRNDFDKLKIYRLIRENNKTIHFSRSNKVFNNDSGSEDEFMLDIEVAVAKKMSNDISRKTRMGMAEKAEQGFYPSIAPMGYINNKITRLIDIDERVAPFVRRAFELFASGHYSIRMLENQLYDEGLRSKSGKRVNKSSIAHFLKNPIYYGAFVWRGNLYQGSHEPIISKELFIQVQDVLSGKFHPSIQKKNFYFNNLVICGVCGCKVIGEQKKRKYNYYHCTFSKGRHPQGDYIREEQFAMMFEDSIRKITLPEALADWMKDALRERCKSDGELQENRLQTLTNQYDRINNRLSKLYDAKFDGDIDNDYFKLKENEYKESLLEIKFQIDNLNHPNLHVLEEGCKILELSKRLYPLYLRADYADKARIVKSVASNFHLSDGTLCPTYKKPFSILAKGTNRLTKLPGTDSNCRQGG